MVTKKVCSVCALLVFLTGGAHSQTTNVIRWNDGNLTGQSASANAYHPEPIIFVHGITANRTNWANVIDTL